MCQIVSHDRGEWCESDCRKIIRNILQHDTKYAGDRICLSIYIANTMSLNHVTVTHLCGRPHVGYRTNTIYYRCLTPLSIGNDTNICPMCWSLISKNGGTRREVQSLPRYAKLWPRTLYKRNLLCVCTCEVRQLLIFQ